MVQIVNNELVCVHTCMTVNPEIYQGSIYAEQRISGKYDFSFEMVEFLANLSRGKVDWKSDTAKRCLKVATRKGCYSDPLLNPLGIFTEAGEEAAHDAKIIQGRIVRYCYVNKFDLPSVDQTQTMDEIVVYGNVTLHGIRLLQSLWDILPNDKKLGDGNYIPPMPYNWQLETIDLDGDMYMLMSSTRNNPYIRKAVDNLVKFGLVDLLNLPKHPVTKGKGRAPVGFCISATGTRFYQNYLETYDPKAKFNAYLQAPEEPENTNDSPESTDLPDIVDGENLRELFG